MTNAEFVIWMKGFVEACNDYAPTPKQWDAIKDELSRVSENKSVSVRSGATGVLNISGTTDATFLKGANVSYTTKKQLND